MATNQTQPKANATTNNPVQETQAQETQAQDVQVNWDALLDSAPVAAIADAKNPYSIDLDQGIRLLGDGKAIVMQNRTHNQVQCKTTFRAATEQDAKEYAQNGRKWHNQGDMVIIPSQLVKLGETALRALILAACLPSPKQTKGAVYLAIRGGRVPEYTGPLFTRGGKD
jgi:hypothetical protein